MCVCVCGEGELDGDGEPDLEGEADSAGVGTHGTRLIRFRRVVGVEREQDLEECLSLVWSTYRDEPLAVGRVASAWWAMPPV